MPDLSSVIASELVRARERALEKEEEKRASHVRPWDRGKSKVVFIAKYYQSAHPCTPTRLSFFFVPGCYTVYPLPPNEF